MKVTGKKLRDSLIAKYGSPRSLDDLAKIVVSEVNKLEPLQELYWKVNYHPRVLATHSSPHNTTPNFSLRPDRPTHYRGFEGKVRITFKKEVQKSVGDMFAQTLTHTGTGGSGDGIKHSYHYKIWLDDWPDILTGIDSRIVLHTLIDHKIPFEERHEFNWRADSMPVEKLLADG